MKKIILPFKLTLDNLIYILIWILIYYIILQNIFLSIFCSIITTMMNIHYKDKEMSFSIKKKLDFQINSFIKNIAINSLANNFNVIESISKSQLFLEGTFKKDIDTLYEDIKKDFNYESAFLKLSKKYSQNKVFVEFLDNVLVIKEQSNIDESAKKIFEIASKDSQNQIINNDRIAKINIMNFKNYLINTFLGYVVVVLVIISLNNFYMVYAKSIMGITINLITILVSNFVTYHLINRCFKRSQNEI